jgi:hypothetical protein
MCADTPASAYSPVTLLPRPFGGHAARVTTLLAAKTCAKPSNDVT